MAKRMQESKLGRIGHLADLAAIQARQNGKSLGADFLLEKKKKKGRC